MVKLSIYNHTWKEFKEGFKTIGNNIATIVNTVLLFIVYIIGVGLTAIVAKIVKKHFMQMKINKQAKTYWKDANLKKKPIEKYYRQF